MRGPPALPKCSFRLSRKHSTCAHANKRFTGMTVLQNSRRQESLLHFNWRALPALRVGNGMAVALPAPPGSASPPGPPSAPSVSLQWDPSCGGCSEARAEASGVRSRSAAATAPTSRRTSPYRTHSLPVCRYVHVFKTLRATAGIVRSHRCRANAVGFVAPFCCSWRRVRFPECRALFLFVGAS